MSEVADIARLEVLDCADPGLVALLSGAGLPVSDLAGPGKQFYGVRRDDGTLVAAGGLEIRGEAALLRSCVVAADRRGERLGRTLVEALVLAAAEAGVNELYLLTETAEAFFAALGFRVVDRARVPAAIAGLSQFVSVCPASATVMTRPLA